LSVGARELAVLIKIPEVFNTNSNRWSQIKKNKGQSAKIHSRYFKKYQKNDE